jgi:hypothetical protein
MRVTKWFKSYDWRRYGKPWIAKVVSWEPGWGVELEFGYYLGDADGGPVRIEVEAGEVVRWGQKDYGNAVWGVFPKENWGVVQPDGTILECDRMGAKKMYNDYLVFKRTLKQKNSQKQESFAVSEVNKKH